MNAQGSTSSHRDPRLAGRFLYIDGLRGVAALAVAVFHFTHPYLAADVQPQLDATMPRWARHVIDCLEYGVEVFFVLSGFVIAHSLWGQQITPRFAGNFAVRRSLRLDPPYWVMIAFCLGWPHLVFRSKIEGLFTKFGGMTGVIVNMFYLPDLIWWRSIVPVEWTPRIVGVAWTLCLEVQFYLAYLTLLAIAGLILRRTSPHVGRMIVGALFAVLAIYSMQRWFLASDGSKVNDFGGRWFMFFAGALLYATVARRVAAGWLVAMLALVFAGGVAWREPRAISVTLSIYAAALWGGLQTWLRAAWIQRLGRLSYSFYLVHLPLGVASIIVIMQFSDGSIITGHTAVGFAFVTPMAAALLHRAVEAPAMRLSNRLKPARVTNREAAMAVAIATGYIEHEVTREPVVDDGSR